MFWYIIRRLISALAMLFVVSIVTFLIFYAAPEDPARLTCARNCTPTVLEGNRKALGFDKPITTQYTSFVSGIFVGRDYPDDPKMRELAPQTVVHCDAPCMGYSPLKNKTVNQIIGEGLPVTGSIVVVAFVMWMVVGILGGIIAALNRGKWLDRLLVGLALIGFSLPTFFIGLLLLNFVAASWRLVPPPVFVPLTENPLGWLQNLILPASTIACVFAASYVRLTRAYMIETMSEDYIRTARAKGVRKRDVIRRHGLRAALTPIVTAAGLDVGGLLGGMVITEQVFTFQGLGKSAVLAIQSMDLPVIVGLVLVAAFFVVIASLIVDVLYGIIDPRVRLA